MPGYFDLNRSGVIPTAIFAGVHWRGKLELLLAASFGSEPQFQSYSPNPGPKPKP